MPQLIAPLDFQVPMSTAEYLLTQFGMTVQDVFLIAIEVWRELDDNVPQMLYEAVSDALLRKSHSYQLDYQQHMNLVHHVVTLLYRFHHVLQEMVTMLRPPDSDDTLPFLSFVRWLPDAVVLRVH